MSETKNPYQMNLIEANQTKLYNPGAFWAFNTAKYRALLSNDSVVIKYWYKYEAAKFLPDAYNLFELKRSFYYGDEFTENAEEFYAEKQLNIQVVDRTKPLEESTVLQTPPEEDADGGGADAEMDLQDTNDTDDEEQIDEQS